MAIEEVKTEGLSKTFNIHLSAGELNAIYQDELKKTKAQVVIDGFRKGNAPMQIVERKYGDYIYKDIMESQVDKLSREALKDLKIFGNPKIEGFEGAKGKDLRFNLFVELHPDFDLPKFSEISLDNPVMSISEKEFEEAKSKIIEEIYKKVGARVDSADSKSVVICQIDVYDESNNKLNSSPIGDSVILSEAKNEKNNGESTEDKQTNLIQSKDSKQKFLGSKKGDVIVIESVISEDLDNFYAQYINIKELSGKKVNLNCTVQAIFQIVPDFENKEQIAQVFGCTVEEIDSKIKEIIEKRFESEANNFKKIKLFDALDKILDFDVPSSILKAETQGLLVEISKAKNESEELKSKTDDELEEYASKYALRRIRIGMMLAKYAEERNIQVTNEEYRRAVLEQASRFNNMADEIVKAYTSNQQLIQQLSGALLEEKTVSSITSQEVALHDKKYTHKELEAEIETINKSHFFN